MQILLRKVSATESVSIPLKRERMLTEKKKKKKNMFEKRIRRGQCYLQMYLENIYIILGLLYDNSVYRLPKVAHFIADMKLSFSFIQCHYQESSDLRLFLSQAPAYS